MGAGLQPKILATPSLALHKQIMVSSDDGDCTEWTGFNATTGGNTGDNSSSVITAGNTSPLSIVTSTGSTNTVDLSTVTSTESTNKVDLSTDTVANRNVNIESDFEDWQNFSVGGDERSGKDNHFSTLSIHVMKSCFQVSKDEKDCEIKYDQCIFCDHR